MKFSSLSLALALGLASTVSFAAGNPAGKPELGDFGVDLSARDLSVKPGDDFNRHVSGAWLKSYQLKDYETSFGSFNALRDRSEEQVHGLIEELAARKDLAPGSNDQKVRDFYASYMDRDARDAKGIAPLKPVLDRISAIKSKNDLIKAFANADLDASASPVRIGLDL
ncbi:MAG TPA: M13 family metallopeptidase N-terminal domain-containing protein, partial [Lysobacter sp.]